jgi:hypothetical protein
VSWQGNYAIDPGTANRLPKVVVKGFLFPTFIEAFEPNAHSSSGMNRLQSAPRLSQAPANCDSSWKSYIWGQAAYPGVYTGWEAWSDVLFRQPGLGAPPRYLSCYDSLNPNAYDLATLPPPMVEVSR